MTSMRRSRPPVAWRGLQYIGAGTVQWPAVQALRWQRRCEALSSLGQNSNHKPMLCLPQRTIDLNPRGVAARMERRVAPQPIQDVSETALMVLCADCRHLSYMVLRPQKKAHAHTWCRQTLLEDHASLPAYASNPRVDGLRRRAEKRRHDRSGRKHLLAPTGNTIGGETP
jgi:hypothetical protein